MAADQGLSGGDGELPPQRRRPFYPKRSHTKSRAGCLSCKARKVKCDETFPTCGSCYFRSTRCVYSQPPPLATPSSSSCSYPTSHQLSFVELDISALDCLSDCQTQLLDPFSFECTDLSSCSPPAPSSIDANPAGGPQSLSPWPSVSLLSDSATTDVLPPTTVPLYTTLGHLLPAPSFDHTDLKLLWHYTVKTCTSFTVDPDYQRTTEEIFRSTIVSYAMETPCLLDSLFALSCMDIQKRDASFTQSRTLRYCARAFESFRLAVHEACPQSFPALLVNSLLLTALSSHGFREPCSYRKPLYIVDWMFIWKGIDAIVDLVGLDVIFETGLSIIFFRPATDLEAASVAIPTHLLTMVSSIPLGDPDQHHIATYNVTLQSLGSLYHHLRGGFGPDLSLRITTWLSCIPKTFAHLCQRRRPRALVILGHYAAFIKLVQEVWWLEDVGERSIDDISEYLDSDWHSLVKIPLAVRHLTDRTSIASVILEEPLWKNPERPREEVDAQFSPFRDQDPKAAAFSDFKHQHHRDVNMDYEAHDDANRRMSRAALEKDTSVVASQNLLW